jgi:AraC-like DNA-binding protein
MSASALSVDPYFRQRLAELPAPDAADTVALIGAAALAKFTNVAGRSAKQLGDNAVPKIQNVTAHRDASYVEIHRGSDMKSANETISRTNVERATEWLQDVPTIKRRFADALKEDHGHKHSHLKLIAREAGASPRTVEKWTGAQYLPGLEHFLRLVPTSPAIQKMLAELMTLDADTDPRHGVLLQQIQRQG